MGMRGIFFIALVVLVTSCELNQKDMLIGIWKVAKLIDLKTGKEAAKEITTMHQQTVIEYRSDGTHYFYSLAAGEYITKWSLEDNAITLVNDNKDTLQIEIKKLTEDELVYAVEVAEGLSMEWHLVPATAK